MHLGVELSPVPPYVIDNMHETVDLAFVLGILPDAIGVSEIVSESAYLERDWGEAGESAMARDDLVLAALAAGGENASYTPVQVQKLFFLIDREVSALIGGQHFNFRPYDYGPFDSSVYVVLSALEARGLIQTTSLARYRVYSLTPAGYQQGVQALGRIVPDAREYFCQVTAWIRRLSFQQLVAAIYNKYPEMKVNSVFRG
jgi:hypothetical protein